jgi:hypothetical protein
MDYYKISAFCLCAALALLIMLVLHESNKRQLRVNWQNVSKQIITAKIEGVIYGATITTIIYSLLAMYIFTPKAVVTFVVQLINTTINQT